MEIRPGDFTIGQQPCATFKEHDEIYGHNRHECFGPFVYDEATQRMGRAPGLPPCAGSVSFCDNCTHDHHGGGYDTCPQTEEQANPPLIPGILE